MLGGVTFFVAAQEASATNVSLVSAVDRLGIRACTLPVEEVFRCVVPGDTVLARIDVLPTLDGVQACLWDLRRFERWDIRLLNGPNALLASHDKLLTALRLAKRGLPHPRTAHFGAGDRPPDLRPPVVVKPRFGSWGRDVILCETRRSLEDCLVRLGRRRWFRRQGALLQELVPSCGHDLRLIVARGEVVGAIERVAAPGEWRTNVSQGGTRRPVDPPPAACALALAAAEAVGGDLVGVDLLPSGPGYTVLELNGAVDFTLDYSLGGRDVFDKVARVLALEELASVGFHEQGALL
jgi:ribosomal protein S6--L-glutamate ligase